MSGKQLKRALSSVADAAEGIVDLWLTPYNGGCRAMG